jgi:hypothetical protein
MTAEEQINKLEDKLNEVIELLRFLIRVDNGLTKDATDLLINHLNKLED